MKLSGPEGRGNELRRWRWEKSESRVRVPYSLGGRIGLGRMHCSGVEQTFSSVPVQLACEGEPRHRQTRLIRDLTSSGGRPWGAAGRADGRIRLVPGRDASRPNLCPLLVPRAL